MAMTLAGHLTHRENSRVATEGERRKVNPALLAVGLTSWALVALRVVFAVAG